MAGQLIRDVRATLDIDVAKAQAGMRDLEKSSAKTERALKDQEDAARGYQRQLERTGTAANTMRRRLEAATRALPKITISADSSEADSKLANLRESLQGLSGQKIGIDVKGADALAEMRRIKAELEDLAATEADPIVRADVQIALRELERVDAELDKLDGRRVEPDVDTRNAAAGVDELAAKAGTLGSLFSEGFGVIGKAGPANVAIAAAAIAGLPLIAQVAAAGIVAAIGGGLVAVGITAAAQSDQVKFAWSEAVSAIKAELGDAAAPLEDSAIRAADVAERAFARLKPSLARIFKDVVPDVDAFVDAVANGVVSLGPSLEKVGRSFGDLLSGLADRMPSIMSNLSSTFETFSQIMDENPTMLADLITDATELLRVGAEVLSWSDEIKVAFSAPLGPAGSQAGTDYFFQQLFGGTPEEIMAGMEQFPALIAQINSDAGRAIDAMHGLGGGADTAAAGVRNLNDALEEHFDPAQKALDAEIRLKQAIEEANRAAKDKNMTEIERLQAVQNTTKAISDAAKAEVERTGKTQEAGQAFLDQLPHLQKWAGDNETARTAIAGLGESLGITTMKTKDGIIAVDAFGKAVQILPNGKKVDIDASTAKGKQQIADFLLYVARQKGTIDVHVRTIYDTKEGQEALRRKQSMPAAAGALLRYADGGLERYATGGMRPQPPGIVSKPTVLFGEGSSGRGATEAFIPYEGKFRDRAVEILAQVASDFGFGLYGLEADRQVQQVAVTVSDAATQLGAGLGSVNTSLTDAFGQTGTLTSAISHVGTAGDQMRASWETGATQIGDTMTLLGTVTSDAVTVMTDSMTSSIDTLTGSVDYLGEVLSAAADSAESSSSKSSSSKSRASTSRKPSKGGSGVTATAKETRGSLGGGVSATAKETRGKFGVSATAKETRGSLTPPGGMISGDYGLSGTPDWTFSSAAELVNASTLRSVPVPSSPAAAPAAAGSGGGGFSIENFYATPEQSPESIANALSWKARGGGG